MGMTPRLALLPPLAASAALENVAGLQRALQLAAEFDPLPLLVGLEAPPGCRAEPVAWTGGGGAAAVAAALRAAGCPVATLALDLPRVPRAWLDYLRRLAIVHWPNGQRAGADPPVPAAMVPAVGGRLEAGAALFHPDALPGLEAAGDGPLIAPGPEDPPWLVLPDAEWSRLAGTDALRRGSSPDAAAGEVSAPAGAARLVDVGGKPVTQRRATAEGTIVLGPRAYPLVAAGALPKGDALSTARIAAIQAVKRTAEAIPLCHPLPIDAVEVAAELAPETQALRVKVTVSAEARTGVEMEALHGAAVYLLTVYDLAKGVERGLVIGELRLVAKSGGAGGGWRAEDEDAAGRAGPKERR